MKSAVLMFMLYKGCASTNSRKNKFFLPLCSACTIFAEDLKLIDLKHKT